MCVALVIKAARQAIRAVMLNINQDRKIPDHRGGIPTNLSSNSTGQLNINTATKCYQMGNVKYPFNREHLSTGKKVHRDRSQDRDRHSTDRCLWQPVVDIN